MAIYRAGEIRKMSPRERAEKLDELRAELLREHGVKAAGGAPKNPGRIRALRKTIARVLTISAAVAGGEGGQRPPRGESSPVPPRPQARPPSPTRKGTAGKGAKPAVAKAKPRAPRRKT